MRRKAISGLAGSLNMPNGILNGEAVVTIDGDGGVSIRNHKGIIRYSDECVIVGACPKRVCVSGEGLSVAYIDSCVMRLEGQVRSVVLSAND